MLPREIEAGVGKWDPLNSIRKGCGVGVDHPMTLGRHGPSSARAGERCDMPILHHNQCMCQLPKHNLIKWDG